MTGVQTCALPIFGARHIFHNSPVISLSSTIIIIYGQPYNSKQRNVYLAALLDGMSDTGIRIVSATTKEIAEIETEGI